MEDWQAAWLAFERGAADNAGIVDHVSFTIMRRMGISKAFTNDGHFRAAGFEALF
jgi:predicted nucleic acid-binding protein